MSYGYEEAFKNSPDSTSYSRRIYDANGRLSRSLSLQRNTNGSVGLLYKPRSDVRASKSRYKIITYYPGSNSKVTIDLDDLPISPNIVRILKEYLPSGLEAKGGSYNSMTIQMNGWQSRYLDSQVRSLTFVRYEGTWRQSIYADKEVDPDDMPLSDEQDSFIDPEKEIAYAREKAGLLTPPPANFPSDVLAWNNGSLKPPFAIPVHYVENWDEKNPPGWTRKWSSYMDTPQQLADLLKDWKDSGVAVIINKTVPPGSERNKVIAAFRPT